MSKPLKISLWAICCVAIGLVMASADGISTEAILQTALLATGIGFCVALIFWVFWRNRS